MVSARLCGSGPRVFALRRNGIYHVALGFLLFHGMNSTIVELRSKRPDGSCRYRPVACSMGWILLPLG